MKSNTEVYSQWLDSKVVLEPTHPPGGQLNQPDNTMASETDMISDNLLLCRLQNKISEVDRFNKAAIKEMNLMLHEIEVRFQEKDDTITELKKRIFEPEGFSDTTNEDLIPSSKRTVGELTPQRIITDPLVTTPDSTADEQLADQSYSKEYVRDVFKFAGYAAKTWAS